MLQPIYRIFGILVIILLLLGSGPFATRAHANGNELWARWKMEVDFNKEGINAIWTVAIGNYDVSVTPAAMRLIAFRSIPVQCEPEGSFFIDGEEGVFDGKGFLTCKTPNFYQAALKLAEEQGQTLERSFLERCECVNPIPWVTGDLTLLVSGASNPIIHETSGAFDFYTPLLPNNGGNLQATSNLLLNGQLSGPTMAWSVQEKGNQLWSGSGVQAFQTLRQTNPGWDSFLVNFDNAAHQIPQHHFLQWADAQQWTVAPDNSQLSISNLETAFTIGYDGKHFFKGRIRKLAWDPGCTPH